MNGMMDVRFQEAWFGPFSMPRGPVPTRATGIPDMMNTTFQKGWFGPFAIPDIYVGPEPEWPVDQVYDFGPFDGLKTTSMWAQRMAQIPLRNYAQNPAMGGPARVPVKGLGEPVFCYPGHVPVQTGVPGRSKCVPYSAPSMMIGPQPAVTVSTTVPPAYPTARTFPVGPYWGWRKD